MTSQGLSLTSCTAEPNILEPTIHLIRPIMQRACRRHGIQRWPRRQLLKLSRAIDQIAQTTTDPAPTPKRRSQSEGVCVICSTDNRCMPCVRH